MDQGYHAAEDWIHNVEKALNTQNAKKLLKEMKKTSPHGWWHGLKRLSKKS